jgi:hypothetical protein
MNKKITGFFTFVLVGAMALPGISFAQTAQVSSLGSVEYLNAQFESLQKQVIDLQAKITGQAPSANESHQVQIGIQSDLHATGELTLARDLSVGSEGEEARGGHTPMER